MGILSDSARNAYKRGTRRAHVPEWFAPAAYVFGGLIALFLILGTLFSDLPEPAPQENAAAGEVLVIGGDGDTSIITSTDDTTDGTTDGTTEDDGAAVTAPPVTDAGASATSAGVERVELLDGGSATLPAGAWATAQQVTFALLTGDFSQVKVYPGKTAPILLTTWDEPSILGLVSVEENPDDSLRVVLRVDPDVSGSEPPRDVPILLAASEGGWAYLPG